MGLLYIDEDWVSSLLHRGARQICNFTPLSLLTRALIDLLRFLRAWARDLDIAGVKKTSITRIFSSPMPYYNKFALG